MADIPTSPGKSRDAPNAGTGSLSAMKATGEPNTTRRQCAQDLLERTETTLAAIYCREVRATDEDTWTLQGFRLALQWVLSYAA